MLCSSHGGLGKKLLSAQALSSAYQWPVSNAFNLNQNLTSIRYLVQQKLSLWWWEMSTQNLFKSCFHGSCMHCVPAGICWRWQWGHTAAAWCYSSPNIAAPPHRVAITWSWRYGGPAWTLSLPSPPSELYMPPAGLAAPPLVGEERQKEKNKRGFLEGMA